MSKALSASQWDISKESQAKIAVLNRHDPSDSNRPIRLAVSEGQLKVHSAPFRGSFPDVLSEALRAAGLGRHIMVAQLLKGGVDQGPNGVVKLCDRLEWIRPSISCCISQKLSKDETESKSTQEIKSVLEIWNICKNHLLEGNLDQLVLDEVGLAISLGYLEERELISVLEQRPLAMDVILTGPAIPSSVIGMADQVTVLRGGF